MKKIISTFALACLVLPTLGHVHGTVYVLPEDQPVQAMVSPGRTPSWRRPPATSAMAGEYQPSE